MSYRERALYEIKSAIESGNLSHDEFTIQKVQLSYLKNIHVEYYVWYDTSRAALLGKDPNLAVYIPMDNEIVDAYKINKTLLVDYHGEFETDQDLLNLASEMVSLKHGEHPRHFWILKASDIPEYELEDLKVEMIGQTKVITFNAVVGHWGDILKVVITYKNNTVLIDQVVVNMRPRVFE